jgi:NADPH-dependent 2,4-dienoyl-CoA reductase/sulfur reductase-like enzyme
MVDRKVDVAIVGGGLAGAAAADVLGRHGANVLVLDDNLRLGGQYLRGGRQAGASWTEFFKRRGLKLIDALAQSPVDVRTRAEVLGIEPGYELLAAAGYGELFTVRAGTVLLATGARERFIPFQGWTLPGVMATGAAQILIKQSGVLPARRTVVAGAGLFLNAVAGDIRKNGGEVPAVLDAMPIFKRVPPPALVPQHLSKFLQGGALLARLLLGGVQIRNSTRILETRGAGGLNEVVAGRIDRRGAVIAGSETVHSAGGLAVGYGFAANTELAQLAGCGLAYNASLGGWVVKVDEDLATDVDGIFAAGEITAIGGAAKSLTEGRIAGYSILRRMGVLKPDEMKAEISALKKMRRRQMAFARYFNSQSIFTSEYLAGWIGSLPDDVPVCRCEAVSLGDVRRAVTEGFETPAGVKKATRCGMGICQGSTCKTILLDVLAAITGKPLARIPLPSVRMPVKPIYLGTLAGAKP